MPNDNDTNGAGVGWSERKTDKHDPVRLFVVNLGLVVQHGGNDLVEYGNAFHEASPARRRVMCLDILDAIDGIKRDFEDAQSMIRQHMGDMTIVLAGGKVEAKIPPPEGYK